MDSDECLDALLLLVALLCRYDYGYVPLLCKLSLYLGGLSPI